MADLWDALTLPASRTAVISPLVILGALLLGVSFVAYVWLGGDGASRFRVSRSRQQSIRSAANIGAVLAGSGLFFLGVRALQINPLWLGAPIFLWLTTLTTAVFSVWFVREFRAPWSSRRAPNGAHTN